MASRRNFLNARAAVHEIKAVRYAMQTQQRVFRSSRFDVTTVDTANVRELSNNEHTHLQLEAVPPAFEM